MNDKIYMNSTITTTKYKPKNHAKMYAPDNVLAELKAAAEKEHMSQTAFILMAVKAKIKQVNK